MNNSKRLPLTEELDFHYLLGLIPPLTDDSDYAWLPELFSIIGYEKLIELSKYAGGELIRIPTLDQLSTSVLALQWFYDIYIAKRKSLIQVPVELKPKVLKILEVYNARDDLSRDKETTEH